MAAVNVTPELRFPEFEESWVDKKLGDICKHISYGLTVRPKYIKIGVPLISAREIVSGSVDIENAPQISIEDFNKLSDKAKPKKGDIFLSKTGTVGLSAWYQGDLTIAITQNIAVIRFDNPNQYLPSFLIQHFKTRKFLKEAISKVNQSTIMDLQLGDIRKLSVDFPQSEEQQKIASFLTAIDERIQLLQKKKAKLEEYKKGVMQKLFSQEIRFKDENGNDFPDWEEKKLGEICEKQSSNISANSLEESGGDYKIYGATGFLQFVDFYREEEPYISIVKDGAGVGRILLCEAKSSVLGTLDILKPKDENNIKFLYALISNIRFEKYITGSTIPHIYFKDYSKEKINVPIPAEQHKIATFLTSLDNSIESIRIEIDGSIEYKKGLLQKMFV